ncbi:MAG: SgcJ/EcaC family oxidoreductase [Cryomorphaceae bacterium]|nr:SgcJ/EcaC family oxidoreductase [Flavobacteriales bacterium]
MKSPQKIADLFARYWNEYDAVKLAGLFAEDADFINVTGLWWENRKSIERAHDYGLRVIFPDSQLSVLKTKFRKLGDGAGVVIARMLLKGQSGLKGKNAGKRQTIFTFVMEKKESDWICVSAQNNDITRGAETHIRREDGSLEPVSYR